MKNLIIAVFTIFSAGEVLAQEVEESKTSLKLSGYADVYYANFSNDMEPNEFQPYTTVAPRDARFGLNIAQTSLAYTSEKVRGNISLHWGDIPQATWSSEFTNIQEANIGIRLKGDWWLDAGFFTTHIGTESFLPKNNFLSSTAIATYNEPFYQAGAKLSYSGSEKWYGELWVVNGYNYFLDVNDAKSVGILLSYNFNDNTSLTYTNLFGKELPSGSGDDAFRTYHNLYLNAHFADKWFLQVGGDIGTQSHSGLSTPEETAIMYNALATLRYQVNDKLSFTGRGELFNDENGFISGLLPSSNDRPQGLEMWGITMGSEFRPIAHAYIRGETRFLHLNEDISFFEGDLDPNKRWEVLFTMGYQFDKLFER
ncbi:hypothetical protein C7S20_07805 [Christiangramia fulva]|uniref:Porin n=1 Tax=Christiangramia fulva TaxID=2126553 RepID=A0A2R3Z4M2_9FLAO|nr:outer membrane beta-barrel protein [Christiangramia fulva]AVR45184.1 hypothetical protein C7S20_07805 [Christiangramia fulva]